MKTGLIIGKGRWKKELCGGDTIVDKEGNHWIITYQKEWGAFIAELGDDLLFLAQNEKWGDREKLIISECKLID